MPAATSIQDARAGRDMIAVAGDYVVQAPPAPSAALHQLPPPPGDFTGRQAELDELMAKVGKGGVTISGLQGMGGIGKTALALKIAEQLRPRYPDAQIYLDLKGTSGKPLTAAETMGHVIRAYQPTARPPEGEAELAGLYRSVLDGQRALLLMDNAREKAQAEPLIPPASCVLLVTSRWHFTLPGWFAKDLATLPPEDARKLLLEICARIDGHAGEIARLCGYLPLALRLAGSALAARADLTVERYLSRLSDARQRLEALADGQESVQANLGLSYDLLTPPMQKLFRMLAVFPETFHALGAAAVWAMEADPAQEILGELVRYSLVEWIAASKRYELHDLVRDCAASRLTPEERDGAERRYATHYVLVAALADELYLKGGDDILRGLRLFDVEWTNIREGQRWAAAHAETEEEAARLCNLYPSAAAYCLDLRLHPRERIEWLETALGAARRLKDRQAEGAHLGNMGMAYRQLGEAHRAIENFEKILALHRETGDREAQGKDLGNLGSSYLHLGEPRRAIEYYEQALAIDQEIGNRRDEAQALGNLGVAYAQLGEARRAIEYYNQQLVIAREIGDRQGEGNGLGNLGIAYDDLGEPRRAIEYFQLVLAIDREIGDRRGEGNALFNMSLTLDRLDQRADAVAHAEAALEIYVEIEDPNAEMVRRQLAQWKL